MHDDPFGLFLGHHLEHVLERQWLEIQPIRRVVVGRDGLRVAVDHDGLEPVVAQLQGRMHTAVIKLDALADAVGPAAQDHDLALVGWVGLAFLLVGGIHVGRRSGEFGSAGIDALVDRHDAELVTFLADGLL